MCYPVNDQLIMRLKAEGRLFVCGAPVGGMCSSGIRGLVAPQVAGERSVSRNRPSRRADGPQRRCTGASWSRSTAGVGPSGSTASSTSTSTARHPSRSTTSTTIRCTAAGATCTARRASRIRPRPTRPSGCATSGSGLRTRIPASDVGGVRVRSSGDNATRNGVITQLSELLSQTLSLTRQLPVDTLSDNANNVDSTYRLRVRGRMHTRAGAHARDHSQNRALSETNYHHTRSDLGFIVGNG